MTKTRLDPLSLLAGLAAGAGAALAAGALFQRRPERAPAQLLVDRALSRAYWRAKARGAIRLGPRRRFVVFSDHHKGARNRADNFRQCEAAYLAALGYYDERDFTLILLGDAEELQEESPLSVTEAYANVLRREAAFHPGRLVRVYGNHDSIWQSPDAVRRWLDPFFPGIAFQEALLFEAAESGGDEQTIGEVLLIHGHQGTIGSDLLGFLGPAVLPFYRGFQNLTGLGGTSPSRDACLRSKHDNRMYRWASRQKRLILIAGHTHRPVWSSKTHLDKLTEELYALLRLAPEFRPDNYSELVANKKRELEDRQARYPPCDDIVKTRPAYFNTGCCRFEDGDITGIELEDGELRLVKWGARQGEICRFILEQSPLEELFLYL